MPGHDLPAHCYEHQGPLCLEGGGVLPCYRLAYETWGTLNQARDNAVVILHALSGSSHAFSSALDPQPGWWQGLIQDDLPLHPRSHFVVCANLLGGCYGSTGPSSIDPRTGQRYGIAFPQITTGDMIEAYRALLQRLGIDRGVTLFGGSLGGMLALEWAVKHPEEVRHALALVAPGRSVAQAIALRAVQREAILADPAWNGGNYHDGPFPGTGLALARKLGMITYRSAREFDIRFGRKAADARLDFLEGRFEIQAYLDHQGEKFVERFDPNTYLYFSRAMDLYDLASGHGSLKEAAARITASTLLIAVDSDFLCPVEQVEEVEEALQSAGKRSRLTVLQSMYGHDAFLKEPAQVVEALRRYFEEADAGEA